MLRSSRALVCAAALVCLTLLSPGFGPVFAAGSDILTFLFRVGTPFVYGSAPAQFAYPMGVAIDSTGRIIVTDTESYGAPDGGVDVANNRIQIFNADGSLNRIVTTAGGGAGDFYYPTAVAVDSLDQIVVADSGNNRILIFSPASTPGGPVMLQAFGTFGNYDPVDPLSDPGPAPSDEFNFPSGVAVKPGTRLLDPTDVQGRIAILDNSNHRVVVLNAMLEAATGMSVGFTAADMDENAPGAFFYPWGVALDAAGVVYVTDTENHRVQAFSPSGVPLWQFGSTGPTNDPGDLQRPTGIAVDALGRLFVSDTDRSRILRIDLTTESGAGSTLPPCRDTLVAVGGQRCRLTVSDGRILEALVIGRFGSGEGEFIYPHGIAQTPGHRIVVVDTNNQVFQVFETSDLRVDSAVLLSGASVGEPVTMEVQVRNTGASTLLTSVDARGGTLPGSLTAPAAVSIAPNALATFTLTFVPVNDGSLGFQVRALGIHTHGETVTTPFQPTNTVAIVPAAGPRLSAQITAPALVGIGAPIEVVIAVRNTGGSTFTSLTPVLTSSPLATAGPSSADLATPLEPGQSRMLTYSFIADALGAAVFSATVGGTYSDVSLPGGTGALSTGAGAATVQISSDVTAPVTTVALSSAEPRSAAGWYRAPVTVTLAAADDGGTGIRRIHYTVAGLVSYTQIVPASSTSVLVPYLGDTNITYWAEDNGGNIEAPRSLQIRIDSELPAIGRVSTSPGPNEFGWNNTAVELRFIAGDGISGVAWVTPPTIVTTEGAAQVVPGKAVDLAGNEVFRDGVVSIDKTAPVVTCAPDRAAGPSGWYTANVTVTCTAVDQPGLSGVVPGSVTPPQTFSATGVHTVVGEARDFAGNVGTQVLTIKVDKTAPVMTCSTISGGSIWPPNHKMIPWTVGVNLVDPASGVAGFRLVGYWSNEADEGLGDGHLTSDMQGWTLGEPDVSGLVRSERSGLAQGRIYTLKYEGVDIAGNVASCQTATIGVPHDQGRAAPAPAKSKK